MRHTHKVISAVVLGIFIGLLVHHNYEHWGRLGREAFLANESQRFDRFMAVPHSAAGPIVGGVVIVLALVGVYELMSLGLSKLLKSAPPDSGSSNSLPSPR